MADYNLGRARGTIDIDAKGARRGLQQAGGDADKFRGKMAGAAPSMRRAGAAMLGAGAALAAGIGIAVKASADFEQQLSNVKALGGTTEEQMEQIREAALRIGRDTSFGASQAASAMVQLRKAGIPAVDIINGAADATVALAEAGELEIPRAAEVMSAAMNTFNVAAEDAGLVSDILAGAASASATDVAALGESLQQVGATAATVGVPLDQTSTALAVLAKRGITGGKAGTTLNRMLLNLQPASAKAEEAMRELGLITEDGANQFFDAEGNIKSMAEVSGILGDSLDGLSKQQKTAALETIFGSRAISAASALAEQGAEGFNNLAGEIEGISAAEVAEEKLNNLSGSMTILKGTIETFLIGAGSPLQSMLKGVVDGVTSVVNALAQMDPRFQKAAMIGAIVTAALLILGGAFLMILGVIPAITAGFATFSTVIIPVVAPILGVVAAIAALVAVAILLYKNFEPFRNLIQGIVNWFKNLWTQAQNLWAIFKSGDDVIQGFAEVFDNIFGNSGRLVGTFKELFTFIRDTWIQIQEIFTAASEAIIAIVTWFVEQATAFWEAFGEHIIEFVKAFLRNVFQFFERTLGNIMQVIEGVLRVIRGIFDVFAGIFTGDWQRVWGGIQKIFSGIWSAIQAIIKQVLSTIAFVIKNALQIIKTVIGAAMALIAQIWRGTWNAIKTFFSNIWQSILRFVRGQINKIKGEISATLGAIKRVWNSAWNAVKRFLSDVWNGIKRGVREGIGAVLDYIRDFPSRVLRGLGNIGSFLYSAGKDLLMGLVRGIGSVASAPVDAVKGVVSKVRNLLPFSPAKEGPLRDNPPDEAGRTIGEMLAEGLTSSLRDVIRATADVTDGVVDSLPGRSTVPAVAGGGRPGGFAAPSRTETINLNGDLVLPNIKNGNDAQALLDGLRQAARRGGGNNG